MVHRAAYPAFVHCVRTLTVLAVLGLGLVRPVRAYDAPVSPDATPEARALLEFLGSLRGKYILSGQQEFPGWPDVIEIGATTDPDFKRIVDLSGRMPAVRGFDFLFYTYSASGRSTQRSTDRAIAWWRSGGIVTFCVHLFMDIGSPAGSPQFYVPGANGNATGTTFDISRAVIGGTAENTELLAKFDLLAAELKKLRDAGVPVIWRPFHECSGGWFWWGAKGAAPFKEAYRMMFDRFTRVHGLNNLIWVYNPADAGSALGAWYPGDDVVDMISLDVYPPNGTHPTYATAYEAMHAFRSGRKVVAMTENGPIPDPDALFAENAHWAYFCTWNGYFIQNEAVNSAAFIQRVFNHPRVLTRDELAPLLPPMDAAPTVLIPPHAATAGSGANVTLSVVARGSAPLAYQWHKDGSPLSGATAPALTLTEAAAADSGAYAVTVSNGSGSVTTEAVTLTVGPAPFVPRPTTLMNLSTRARVGTGDHLMIGGFVIGGSSAKRLLIRAAGPTLGDDGPLGHGVQGALPDPELLVTTPTGVVLARNDDWGAGPDTATLEAAFLKTGAFPLVTGSRDAALLIALPPGHYTALVRGVAGQTGIALVEVYDVDEHSPARLINLSTRADVGQGDNVLIAGFVVAGTGTTDVLLRAVGPGLTQFFPTGWLSNPDLTLPQNHDLITAANDDWSTAPNTAALVGFSDMVGAFELEAGSADAAMFQAMPPGLRTAIVTAPAGTTGIALAELYITP